MSASTGPERLLLAAAPGSALEASLSAARARGPSDAQLRALEASLAASLGALAMGAAAGGVAAAARAAVQTAPAAVAPAAAPALLSTGALKVTAAAVMTFAATTGGVAVYRHARHDTPPALTAARSPRALRAALSPAVSPAVSPVVSPVLPAPVPATAVAPPEVATRPLTAAEGPGTGAPPAVSPSIPPRPRIHAAPPDELALIERAQQLLARDPAQALALVEQNRRALDESAFAQEGEVIATAALAGLGRTVEARDHAVRFLERFPDSVHAPRMRRVAASVP